MDFITLFFGDIIFLVFSICSNKIDTLIYSKVNITGACASAFAASFKSDPNLSKSSGFSY